MYKYKLATTVELPDSKEIVNENNQQYLIRKFSLTFTSKNRCNYEIDKNNMVNIVYEDDKSILREIYFSKEHLLYLAGVQI